MDGHRARPGRGTARNSWSSHEHSLRKGEKFDGRGLVRRRARTRPGSGGGLHPHRRRLHDRRPAARGQHLVPRQRPPLRRGVVHLPRHRAQAPRGRGQRRPGGQGPARPGDHLDLEGRGPDGQLPHHHRRGPVRPRLLPRGRDPVRRRDRPRPARTPRGPHHRRAAGDLAGRRRGVQAAPARDRRPGGRGDGVVHRSRAARNRTGTTPSSRCTPSVRTTGPRCRT